MTATEPKVGVLLINVGTPDSPATRDVRRYLREFLSDPRVLDIHPLKRWLLLRLILLPFRSARSAEAYARIWGGGRSPLLAIGESFASALQRRLGDGYDVVLSMRYGNPSIASGLRSLRSRGTNRIVVFPLYPQVASSTTGTSLQEVFRNLGRLWTVPSLSAVPPFYDHTGFVRAFAEVGRPVLQDLRPDHVLFSFHGLPQRHILKSDETGAHCLRSEDCCSGIGSANRNCYRAQCFATARLIASESGVPPARWSVSFQSRLGRDPWTRPYTDETIRALAARGTGRLAVYCPAFVADCLETIEEIGREAREDFLAAGGHDLWLVPSLNVHPVWVDAAVEMVRRTAAPPDGPRLCQPPPSVP